MIFPQNLDVFTDSEGSFLSIVELHAIVRDSAEAEFLYIFIERIVG